MATTTWVITSASMVVIVILLWKVLNWLWLRPKRLERMLREQGLEGNSYTFLVGDVRQMVKMGKEAKSKPMNNFSHDIVPRVSSFFYHTINKHGKNSFIWFGPKPSVIISDPQLLKDVLNNNHEFPKPHTNPLIRLLASGVVSLEGDKWSKHRKIINPAFHIEKLKNMLPAFFKSCNDMISTWEEKLSSNESCEIDVWPFFQNMTGEVISQTAFGGNIEEGRKISKLQKELADLITKIIVKANIPGWRFLPTSTHKKIKEIDMKIEALLKAMIIKREKALTTAETSKNDLLGLLLESNYREIQENGNNKNIGMTLEDVIDECKVFYFAGQETTTNLLVWTMILLSRYSNWQAHAREEVLKLFGNQQPNFDGLSHLKIVTMILYEVLRLYPPVTAIHRTFNKDMKLGNLTLPGGARIMIPIALIHHDTELWGDDAKEFKPERFSEGVLKATKGQASFLPFGGGPRICIGQNFAMLEAKMALSIILQHFSFELSPTYTHAPTNLLTLKPEYGAQILLHRL